MHELGIVGCTEHHLQINMRTVDCHRRTVSLALTSAPSPCLPLPRRMFFTAALLPTRWPPIDVHEKREKRKFKENTENGKTKKTEIQGKNGNF
jgi:hypothetical protein